MDAAQSIAAAEVGLQELRHDGASMEQFPLLLDVLDDFAKLIESSPTFSDAFHSNVTSAEQHVLDGDDEDPADAAAAAAMSGDSQLLASQWRPKNFPTLMIELKGAATAPEVAVALMRDAKQRNVDRHLVLWLGAGDGGGGWETVQAVKAEQGSPVLVSLPIKDVDYHSSVIRSAEAAAAINTPAGLLQALQQTGAFPSEERLQSFDLVGPSFKAPSRLLRAASSQGKAMIAWTLNQRRDMEAAVDLAAEWGVSDFPLKLRNYLRKGYKCGADG